MVSFSERLGSFISDTKLPLIDIFQNFPVSLWSLIQTEEPKSPAMNLMARNWYFCYQIISIVPLFIFYCLNFVCFIFNDDFFTFWICLGIQ